MFELEIKGCVYAFNFGMGFMREINKKYSTPIDGVPEAKKNIGLQYAVAGIIDKDVEALAEVLFVANKGMTPRVTLALIDEHIDDADTDINALFESVLDFLKKSNATKNVVDGLLKLVAAQQNKA